VRLSPATGVLALLLAVGAVALSGCGTARSTPTTSATVPANRPSPRARARPTRVRHRPGPRIGAAQRVPAPGTTLIVTVTSLIDPLRGSGAKVPQGTKAVGVLVSVRNAGRGGYDSSATGDFSLLSAGGPAAPVFVPAGACQTPLQDFMNAISAGELRTGCVAFAVPSAQAPSTVRFSPDGGATGHKLSWVVVGR
jgi:hypothetical protein